MKKKFLYILSPSYASYIQWRPILKNISHRGDVIDILLPKPLSYRSMIPKLREIFQEINCNYVYIYENPLLTFSISRKQLNKFEKIISTPKFNFFLKIRSLFSRLEAKLRINLVHHLYGDFIRRLCSIKIIQKLYKNLIFKYDWDYILYDIGEEKKTYTFNFLPLLYSLPRYSLYHGLDINITHQNQMKSWVDTSKLNILDYTGKNKSFYKKVFNINDVNYKIIGIPKHNVESGVKVNTISLKEKILKENNLPAEVKILTLASRPEDYINFCSPNSRKVYLQTIGNFLNNNTNYHLLIKSHPKEQNKSKNYWSKQLNLLNNSNKFSLTNLDMIDLASISHFGFCFFSSSCVDFAFKGKPMIEMTSLNDTLLGNLSSAFDQEGNTLTGFSSNQLAININNENSLCDLLRDIEESYYEMREKVMKGYQDCFGIKNYDSTLFSDLLDKEHIRKR